MRDLGVLGDQWRNKIDWGRNTSGQIIKRIPNKRLYHTCRVLRGHTDFLLPYQDQKKKKKNLLLPAPSGFVLALAPCLQILTATMLSQPNIKYSHKTFCITQFTEITL